MNKQVIIACDFSSKEDFVNFISKFDSPLFLKIGMELFYNGGVEIIKYALKKQHKVFLDLKLHDIPNTVYKTLLVLKKLDVSFISVHASGGKKMLEAAAKALEGSKTKLVAVTVLTSLDDHVLCEELNVNSDVEQQVLRLAKLAKKCKINHIVCSANEVKKIKNEMDFKCITPGIRLANDSFQDQKRVTTPKDAYEFGSDYIVVGRSITKSDDVLESYKKIVKDFGGQNE